MFLTNNQWVDVYDLDDKQLEDLAAKFHVETKENKVITEQETDISGNVKNRRVRKIFPVDKDILRERLIERMTLDFYIPKEMWTERQTKLWQVKGLGSIKNGKTQAIEAEKIGVLIRLQGGMIEVDDEIGELIKRKFNTTKEKKNSTSWDNRGNVVQTAKWEENPEGRDLVVHERKMVYECKYGCGFTSHHDVGIRSHERHCSENPTVKAAQEVLHEQLDGKGEEDAEQQQTATDNN